MKDQLISYETAVLAKEKGFDEWTLHAFELNGIIAVGAISGAKMWNRLENRFARPTQSLLHKWLREKYDILVEVHK